MNIEFHSDKQRIDLLYDLIQHDVALTQLQAVHNINYNTIRNIKRLYLQQEGETYKHVRMYSDINNVALKLAILKDPELANQIQTIDDNNLR